MQARNLQPDSWLEHMQAHLPVAQQQKLAQRVVVAVRSQVAICWLKERIPVVAAILARKPKVKIAKIHIACRAGYTYCAPLVLHQQQPRDRDTSRPNMLRLRTVSASGSICP